jgi:Ca2+-binding RTX toxin-like protein
MTFHLSTKVLIIDSTVPNYQTLIDSVSADTEVIVLNAEQDGVAQITQALTDRQNIQTLHILSHGDPGSLQLGNTFLNRQSLDRYAPALQSWSTALAKHADVLLYGCKVAADDWGKGFVRQLGHLTGATFAASTNLTGNAALGGDWNLEFTTGKVRSPIAFPPQARNAYASVLAPFLTETFANADVSDRNWLFGVDQPGNPNRANPFLTASSTVIAPTGGLPGNSGTPDPVGQGVLRLTNADTEQAAFVLYNRALPANAGLSITFDLFSYGGTGADGLSFFLVDGATSPTRAGAFGGSLGYANRTEPTVDPGVANGFIGIGFDEFGNFSNPTEGRSGTEAGSGFVSDAVAIRGSQSSGYTFLTNSKLPFGIDTPGAGTTREQARRRVKIDITQSGLLTVQVDGNQDNDFDDAGEQPITNFSVAAASGETPATLKFGFAASTGSSTNFHEIRSLEITPISDAPETADASARVIPGSSVQISGLSATDTNGIASYKILTLPNSSQGTLFLGNPAAGGTPIAAGQSLTPDQITQVFFQATSTLSSLSQFTYTGVDTLGAEDATPGIVSVAPNGVPLPTPTPTPIDPAPETDDRRRGCRPGEEIEGNRRNNRLTAPALRQDTIFGRRGNDKIRGLDCADILNGGLGKDNVSGGSSSDLVKGRRGNDRIKGNDGDDMLMGQQSNDVVRGGNGNDRINAGLGSDRVNGGRNSDNIRTRRGRDIARGGGNRDTIRGQQGNDKILGGTGNDTLIGGQGADSIVGARGQDVLSGNAGADQFIYRSASDRGDTIRDFETRRDVIVIRPIVNKSTYGSPNRFADYVQLVRSGADTIVRVDTNGDATGGFKSLVTLTGIAPTSLSASNFGV